MIDVSGRQYKADIVIRYIKSGICELTDVVNIHSTTFVLKKTGATSESMDIRNMSARIDVAPVDNSISDSYENVKDSDGIFRKELIQYMVKNTLPLEENA